MYDADGRAGAPVTRILPRSLTLHPGVPDFMTRERVLDAGPTVLEGRAWSGWGPIERVEVSVDGGASWDDADVEPPGHARAWQGWSYAWDPVPGAYVVASRAADAAGNAQPDEPPWNLKGYANNAIERIPVIVRG
jgi:hypothetical protein